MQLEHYEQIEEIIEEEEQIKDEFILNKYLIGDHTSPWWGPGQIRRLRRSCNTTTTNYGDGFLNCAIEYNINLLNRLEPRSHWSWMMKD